MNRNVYIRTDCCDSSWINLIWLEVCRQRRAATDAESAQQQLDSSTLKITFLFLYKPAFKSQAVSVGPGLKNNKTMQIISFFIYARLCNIKNSVPMCRLTGENWFYCSFVCKTRLTWAELSVTAFNLSRRRCSVCSVPWLFKAACGGWFLIRSRRGLRLLVVGVEFSAPRSVWGELLRLRDAPVRRFVFGWSRHLRKVLPDEDRLPD